jgi:hypothetical protein
MKINDMLIVNFPCYLSSAPKEEAEEKAVQRTSIPKNSVVVGSSY